MIGRYLKSPLWRPSLPPCTTLHLIHACVLRSVILARSLSSTSQVWFILWKQTSPPVLLPRPGCLGPSRPPRPRAQCPKWSDTSSGSTAIPDPKIGSANSILLSARIPSSNPFWPASQLLVGLTMLLSPIRRNWHLRRIPSLNPMLAVAGRKTIACIGALSERVVDYSIKVNFKQVNIKVEKDSLHWSLPRKCCWLVKAPSKLTSQSSKSIHSH